MPQDRTLLQHTDSLKVERVVSHAADGQWSPRYEAPTQRLVLPAGGLTEFRLEGQTVLLDSLTLLCLTAGEPYQMKPAGRSSRASIVVSAHPGSAPAMPVAGHWPEAGAWLLPPRALWQLRRHWRAVARALPLAQPTQDLLAGALGSAVRVPRGTGRTLAAVQRAQRFMVTHLAARCPVDGTAACSLQEVADAACCSPFHLARAFRRHTGTSVHGYRQRLRLALALQQLEEGEGDLAALAHDLGFSSQSHLGSVFRQEMGVTPAQARQELAGFESRLPLPCRGEGAEPSNAPASPSAGI